MDFKECGECSACCQGHLIGDAYNHKFGNGKPCFYLRQEKCIIYKTRPDVCKKYQCAWTQHLFNDDLMRPDKLGIMVSVEKLNNEQVLKAIEIRPYVSWDSHEKINLWAKLLNAKLIKVYYNYKIDKDGKI